MARARAALAVAAALVVALLLVSGGSSSDPRTPAALPGLPPPFLTAAVLGDGGLSAGLDAYGDVVDLRSAPAGQPLVEDPLARQLAGSVPAGTGIVPRVSVGGGRPLPLWRAGRVRQRYLPGTNVLLTKARFGAARVSIECGADGEELGCVARPGRAPAAGAGAVRISFERHDRAGRRVHLDDARARAILRRASAADRRWLARARPLSSAAPVWARRMYERSLLVLRAFEDRRSGALAAGAREGWAYVWPRDASAAALALADAGYRSNARRIASFLAGLDLDAAARFDATGRPVPGRAAQGDAWGWAAAAAQATGLPSGETARLWRRARRSWRGRADYQEKGRGEYLGNAIAARAPAARRFMRHMGAKSAANGSGQEAEGLVREAGGPGSGLDSAAAWAVRPFPRPVLFQAVRKTLTRLVARAGPYGIVPSENWPDADPWTAPTAWSAWSLAALAGRERRPAARARGRAAPTAARRDRRAALRLLADLRRAATPAGLLPERVAATSGVPRSTTPLAWSHAFAILAIRQLWPGRRQRESQ